MMQAIQYLGVENEDAVCRFLGGGNSHTHGLGANSPFHVHTLRGSALLRPGNWVVRYSDGRLRVCTPAVFATIKSADDDE